MRHDALGDLREKEGIGVEYLYSGQFEIVGEVGIMRKA